MKSFPGFAFFLLILLRLTQPAYSQSSTLRFEHLTEKDGLSNNSVPSILQDREGFMWFGTFYGLNKYDGYNFTVFKHDPNNPAHSLQGTGSRTIHEDKEGNLWSATMEGGGLNKIDKRTGRIITYLEHLAPNFGSLFEDRQGFLWIGSIGISGKLVRFNPKTEEYIQFTNITGSVMAEDASGRFWMLEPGRLRTFEFNRRSGKFTLNPDHLFADTTLRFSSAHLDKDGMLWIGTFNKGLFTLNTNASPLQLIPYNPRPNRHGRASPTGSSPSEPGRAGGLAGGPDQRGNPGGLVNQNITLNGIYEDADGYLWLATTQGLQRINKKTNEVITYRSDPAIPGTLSSNLISSVYKDREGVLWVGTRNGLNKAIARPKPFKVHQVKVSTLAQSLPENNIQTIVEDRNGIVWFGNSTGLYQFNPKSLQIKHIDAKPADPGSLSSEGVGIIYEDHSGRLWVSTREALHQLDRATGKFIRYPTAGRIVAMDEDRGGKIWIAYGFAGMGERVFGIAYLDSATQKFRYYYRGNSDASLNNAYGIWGIMASRTGDIWVTTGGGGINRLNPKTGKFTYYIPDYPFTAGHFNDISAFALYEDPQGIIWVGTFKSGLNRFDPKTNKFSYYTTREGLPSNQVTRIIGDTKGNLWLRTAAGISRFNPAAGSFRNFDVSDGLPDNISGLSLNSRNGKLLFGTRNGFVSFHPDSIKDNTTPPPVYITGLRVLEKSRPLPSGSLELPYRENYLSFDFVALNFDSPEKNQYAYKLEGLDEDWIYSNTRRYASYTNLAPGKYTFRVKASNNDGIWNEKGTYLAIIIHPPWWRTWWAYTFYVICFLAGLFLADRYQRQRLVQKERERTKERELAQAREIEKAYHELKTTQAQLIQSEKMASLGELTAGIAHEIQNPLNFVNNFSEVSMELVDEMETELANGDKEQAIAIAGDIKQNLQKISHHGKRADFIVKGMLQHSRTSTGEKQATNINTLADEFLKLSYHGLRAKDKSFNAELVTSFDPDLPKVNIVQQDIGRVLLNLFNNAFYAVNQKQKAAAKDYKPTVEISTMTKGAFIEIRVKDNGNGIPEGIKDKIMQPFFTTKPTGEGTGLGLSLSYDIIKAHGGELKVETKDGEGSEFIILLPQSENK